MLKDCIFHSSEVCSKAKHHVYTGLVLNTLLYGAQRVLVPPRVPSCASPPLPHGPSPFHVPQVPLASTAPAAEQRKRARPHSPQAPPQLPRSTPTSLARPRRPDGTAPPTTPAALQLGLQPALPRSTLDDLRPLSQQGPPRSGHRTQRLVRDGTDRALWRTAVRHLAPPGETTNNDPHTQTATNQPSS